MDVGGDAADLMVKEGIQLTDASIRLLASGGKNLIVLLIAISKDQKKLMGKTNMLRLLKDDYPITAFSVKRGDIEEVRKLAKKEIPVLYSFIDKKKPEDRSEDDMLTLISNERYLSQINLILERLGYPIPGKEENLKNGQPRAPQRSSSVGRGIGLTDMGGNETGGQKSSIKAQIAILRAAAGKGRSEREPLQRE